MEKSNIVVIDKTRGSSFDKSILNKIKGLILSHCSENKIKESDVWDEICSEFKYRYGFNVKLRAKNRGMEVLDLVEDMGKMDELFAVASIICSENFSHE